MNWWSIQVFKIETKYLKNFPQVFYRMIVLNILEIFHNNTDGEVVVVEYCFRKAAYKMGPQDECSPENVHKISEELFL